jgi:hypothetical protein
VVGGQGDPRIFCPRVIPSAKPTETTPLELERLKQRVLAIGENLNVSQIKCILEMYF